MAENSKIEWTHNTFNPWRGCTKIAAGCANCYAESQAKRNPKTLGIWGDHGARVVAAEQTWSDVLAWDRKAAAGECPECNGGRKIRMHESGYGYEHCEVCHGTKNIGSHRRRVFCASMADVFEDWQGPVWDHRGLIGHVFNHNGELGFGPHMRHEDVMVWKSENARLLTINDVRRRLFALIDSTPNLDWLLLTKRPENIRRMWACGTCEVTGKCIHRKNVWLGTSIANQADADRNIPELLKCRDLAPVLFVSAKPLLGPVNLRRVTVPEKEDQLRRSWDIEGSKFNALQTSDEDLFHQPPGKIDWLIVGGESGHNARPCRPEWIRSLVAQCQAADVPCFVKQFGGNIITRNDMVEDAFNSLDNGWPDPEVEHNIRGFREDYQGGDCRIHLRDKKGGDWLEWPENLRVREFPKVEAAS